MTVDETIAWLKDARTRIGYEFSATEIHQDANNNPTTIGGTITIPAIEGKNAETTVPMLWNANGMSLSQSQNIGYDLVKVTTLPPLPTKKK